MLDEKKTVKKKLISLLYDIFIVSGSDQEPLSFNTNSYRELNVLTWLSLKTFGDPPLNRKLFSSSVLFTLDKTVLYGE